MTVIPFNRPGGIQGPDNGGRRNVGTACCTACRHEWSAIAPAGAEPLECPSCGLQRGFFRMPFIPADGTVVWQCNCGCEQFYLIRYTDGDHELFCVGCGVGQRF